MENRSEIISRLIDYSIYIKLIDNNFDNQLIVVVFSLLFFYFSIILNWISLSFGLFVEQNKTIERITLAEGNCDGHF